MNIISRAEWGARSPSRPPTPIATPTPRLWLHHTAGALDAGGNGVWWDDVRGIQNFHIDVRKWIDIGYSFVVGGGKVYEGRGAGIAGGHTEGDNSRSHAICLVGDYSWMDPTDRDLAAIVDLTVHGHKNGWWPNQITGGHRDAPGAQTACPGDRLYARIPDLNRLITARLAAPEDDMFDQPDKDKLNATHWLATQANDRVGRIEALLKEQTRLLEAIAEKHGVD